MSTARSPSATSASCTDPGARGPGRGAAAPGRNADAPGKQSFRGRARRPGPGRGARQRRPGAGAGAGAGPLQFRHHARGLAEGRRARALRARPRARSGAPGLRRHRHDLVADPPRRRRDRAARRRPAGARDRARRHRRAPAGARGRPGPHTAIVATAHAPGCDPSRRRLHPAHRLPRQGAVHRTGPVRRRLRRAGPAAADARHAARGDLCPLAVPVLRRTGVSRHLRPHRARARGPAGALEHAAPGRARGRGRAARAPFRHHAGDAELPGGGERRSLRDPGRRDGGRAAAHRHRAGTRRGGALRARGDAEGGSLLQRLLRHSVCLAQARPDRRAGRARRRDGGLGADFVRRADAAVRHAAQQPTHAARDLQHRRARGCRTTGARPRARRCRRSG